MANSLKSTLEMEISNAILLFSCEMLKFPSCMSLSVGKQTKPPGWGNSMKKTSIVSALKPQFLLCRPAEHLLVFEEKTLRKM